MIETESAVFFTLKSVKSILSEGGTSAWRIKRNHARNCEFAVCTRNAHDDRVEGPEPHHSAFLVGKVKDVLQADPKLHGDNRFVIMFSEYALVNVPNVWKGDRNPVKYVTNEALKEMGIDFASLKWEPMPEVAALTAPQSQAGQLTVVPLTMAEAKKGLALTFGVKPEAIEITIRG